MAKFFVNGKWKKRTIAALSVALSLTLSMGIFTACGGSDSDDEDDDNEPAAVSTDTQLLKNGNFEFYSEMNEELADKRALINSPTSWSFTSGSPTSNTTSGIINANEWDYLTASSYTLVPKDENTAAADAIADAIAHWDDASVYDRLEFLDKYSTEIGELTDGSDEEKFFADYSYSIDFEDVEDLREDLGQTLVTRPVEEGEEALPNLLMIHNSRTSDGVVGTAQSYSSGTTIELKAGTAAELSVWVKTAKLTHYYSASEVEVTKNAGAYIGVTHTVGGSSLDQMQIKNINTNGEWQKYTVLIRANTFAATTFRVVLGLGMGDSSDRYEQVNGYALFDDVSCKYITDSDYENAVEELSANVQCGLDSLKEDKIFNLSDSAVKEKAAFALDLRMGFEELLLNNSDNTVDVALTTEYSGTKELKQPLEDTRGGDPKTCNIADLYSYDELKTLAATNGYLKNDFAKDFAENAFPFEDANTLSTKNVVMLYSTNGAAYTATVKNNRFSLAPNKKMLVSFFVKTSSIVSGKTGASAILVDGENETAIASFDSTTVDKIDINDDIKDIRNGWVQCFFFVQNETDETRTFHLKLTYGPTSITEDVRDYSDGYAAFANFEVKELSTSQFGYAATGTYAQSVSLTGKVSSDSKFANAAATDDIENNLAAPVIGEFQGKQSGSIQLVPGGHDNPSRSELEEDGLYTGLLNKDYAENYLKGTELWNTYLNTLASNQTDPEKWWEAIFGNKDVQGDTATQPLLIFNANNDGSLPAYGYFAAIKSVSANSYKKITMRVKVGGGASAYIYLIDTSDVKAGYNNTLNPVMPSVTYWYDDEGNICSEDPSENDKPEIAYYLAENGLYTKNGADDKKYYANFANYETNEDGNLTTSDGTTVFYKHGEKFYAYYNKTTGEYTQEVEALPTEGDFVRYSAPESLASHGTCIVVNSTAENADKWVEVSFYVRTGNEAKDYRLEVWAGARNCVTDENGNYASGTGIPAQGYVFFDAYSDESSDASAYSSMLNAYVSDTKKAYNTANGYTVSDEGYLYDDDNLPVGESAYGNAYYYTFTFYDSPDYVRYDETTAEDWIGYKYTQSEQTETLIWFEYSENGTLPVSAQFLDYSAYSVNVEKEYESGDDGEDSTPDDTTDDNPVNIWLVISSGVLAVALLAVIVIVIVRRVLKKTRKNSANKPPKQKKEKEPKLKIVKDEEETAEPSEEDENGPYSE